MYFIGAYNPNKKQKNYKNLTKQINVTLNPQVDRSFDNHGLCLDFSNTITNE